MVYRTSVLVSGPREEGSIPVLRRLSPGEALPGLESRDPGPRLPDRSEATTLISGRG